MGKEEAQIKPEKEDLFLPTVLYVVTALVYAPLGVWTYQQTATHEQLLQALIVFVFTGTLLFLEKRRTVQFRFRFDRIAQNCLFAAYIAVGLSSVMNSGLLFLVSACLTLASLVQFLLGGKILRVLLPMMVGFGLFLLVIVVLPALDWPLRSLAGQCAASGLELLGQDSSLRIIRGPEAPQLILLAGNTPFHVAPECNGFGIISSSLLMGTVLALYQRQQKIRLKVILLGLTGVMAFFFNGLRIILIVLLAPKVGHAHYDLMHEIVGTICTYTCLGLVWFLFQKTRPRPRKGEAKTQPNC